ncbi:DsbC family protein [Hydrogenophaga sp. 5NK40-0174]|uniref:DsbC family protein n=1 Tax=Hydrogenophaga sp. 5NK40-0174 TaxID=3127649 RepID=UPI0031049A50
MKLLKSTLLLGLLGALSMNALAQEALIRKNLPARLPNLPKIDEVRETPMKGLYEVRINDSEILYTDAKGDFVIQGSLVDTQKRVDLTDERIAKLTAIDFKDLPFKDAFTLVRGNGKRQLAIFEDPNCGYCKRFERDMSTIDNITVHVFLYPILGKDSAIKSRNIWCAADKGQTWNDWMLNNKTPAEASCDADALARNVAMGRKLRVTGTPTLFFADGTRVPGAVAAEKVEAELKKQHPGQ